MEEDLEILKKKIEKCKECKFATCEQCEINWTEIQAIEHLIARNKELTDKGIELATNIDALNTDLNELKERNKELEIKVKYYEDIEIKNQVNKSFKELYIKLNKIVHCDYIPKSKVRELLKEIDEINSDEGWWYENKIKELLDD